MKMLTKDIYRAGSSSWGTYKNWSMLGPSLEIENILGIKRSAQQIVDSRVSLILFGSLERFVVRHIRNKVEVR